MKSTQNRRIEFENKLSDIITDCFIISDLEELEEYFEDTTIMQLIKGELNEMS